MSKLTIVIDNIPESELKNLWQYAAREARKEFGIEIKPTETIKLDYAFIVENYYENVEVITDTLLMILIWCSIRSCSNGSR